LSARDGLLWPIQGTTRNLYQDSVTYNQCAGQTQHQQHNPHLHIDAPIIAGARLSGKINKDWRIGIMDMATARVDSTSFPAQNYLVAAVQRQVLNRSNLAFIYVDRNGLDLHPEDTLYNEWNRVTGMDFNFFTDNNLWQGKVFLHGSLTPDNQDVAHALEIGYRGQNLEVEWEHRYVGENYVADVGFVPRTGYTLLNPDIGYAWYPESAIVNRHGPFMRNDVIFTSGWGFTDYKMSLLYQLLLLNTASYSLGYEENYIKLTEPFDPTNSGKDTLSAGSEHHFRTIAGSIASDKRKLLTYNLTGSYGGFFGGIRKNIQASLSYRFQPFGSISLDMDYNRLTFPEESNNSTFFLIGPKFDITFTDKIFLTTWVQYNNQINNVNINTRFQWRYAPVSDLFIVYTDNYLSDTFKVKSRALVVKLNYWLNL